MARNRERSRFQDTGTRLMFVPNTPTRRGQCINGLGLMRLVFSLGLLMVGCALEAPPAGPPTPNRVMFDEEVYPILLRDCGFPDCHGNPERFFRIYGPGRTRLETVPGIDDPPTEAEMAASYERARSMLASAARAEDTLLLRKPLEIDQGGASHLGIDEHGQDVYRSTESSGYQLLLQWARTGLRETP